MDLNRRPQKNLIADKNPLKSETKPLMLSYLNTHAGLGRPNNSLFVRLKIPINLLYKPERD